MDIKLYRALVVCLGANFSSPSFSLFTSRARYPLLTSGLVTLGDFWAHYPLLTRCHPFLTSGHVTLTSPLAGFWACYPCADELYPFADFWTHYPCVDKLVHFADFWAPYPLLRLHMGSRTLLRSTAPLVVVKCPFRACPR
jgi:hypothetical protein